nr:uncharacterized protein LOC111503382 [Leptinotarsa decemlineata]
MKKHEYQRAFMHFGESELFTDERIQKDIFKIIQKFICEIYSVPDTCNIDAARLQLFLNNYSVSNINEEFDRKNLKKIYASSLPPCQSELFQQFRRANYISGIWNNANAKQTTIFTPEHNGWRLEENQYHFHWFHGDQLPANVSEFLQTSEEPASNNITENDEDDASDEQHHDWLNDENSNNCDNEYDD